MSDFRVRGLLPSLALLLLLLVFTGGSFEDLTVVSTPAFATNSTGSITGFGKVGFIAVEGLTYYIAAVSHADDRLGTISLNLHPGPGNDDFESAFPLTLNSTSISVNLPGATPQPGEPILSTNSAGASVWYRLSSPVSANFLFSISQAADLAVYTGNSLAELVPVASSQWDDSTTSAQLRLAVTAGQGYYLLVKDHAKQLGSFLLRIQPIPLNDDFENALLVEGSILRSSVEFAASSTQPDEPHPGEASVWWEWTSPFTGNVAVDAFASFEPSVIVYTGTTLENLVRVSGPPPLDRSLLSNGANAVSFRAIEGQTYFIAVVHEEEITGLMTLRLKPGLSNDDFANALVLTQVRTASSTHGATPEPGEPPIPVSSFGASLWWRWSPESSGPFAFEAVALEENVTMSLFTGDSLTNLLLLASSDSSWGGAARFNIRATTNDTYYIRVIDSSSRLGSFTLQVLPGPPNDDFANAIPLAVSPLTATTVGATPEQTDPIQTPNEESSVWYSWIPEFPQGYEIHISNPPGNTLGTRVSIFQGDSITNLVLTGSVASTYGQPGSAPFSFVPGARHYILVQGKDRSGGPFTLTLTPASSNDLFEFANEIEVNATITANTLGATRQPNEPLHDGSYALRTLWWHLTAPQGDTFNLVPLSSGDALEFEVYTGGTLELLVPVPTTISYTPAGLPIESFQTEPQRTYYIALYDESTGRDVSFELKRSSLPNDDFASATPFTGTPISGNTTGATREEGEPQPLPGSPQSFGSGATVWYKWNPPSPGTFGVMIDRGKVLAYTGTALTNLVPLPDYRITWNHQLNVFSFRADPSQTYYFLVDLTPTGPFTFNILPAPKNDDFENRLPLTVGAESTIDRFFATQESDEPAHSPNTFMNSLWWKWTAPTSGGYHIQATTESGPAIFALYTGTALTNLVPVKDAHTVMSPLSLSFYALAGTEYSLAYSQRPEGPGPVTLSIEPTVAHDDFAHAIELQLGTAPSHIVPGATRQPGEPLWGNPDLGTLWYTWTAPADGPFYLEIARHDFPVELAVFTGDSLEQLTLLNSSTGLHFVSFRATAGVTYRFAVALDLPPAYQASPFLVFISPSPANDDFSNPTLLQGEFVLWSGTTEGATIEPGEPLRDDAFDKHASVWASWVAPYAGTFRIGRESGTTTVFEGNSLSELVELASGSQRFVDFPVQEGHTYRFRYDTAPNVIRDLDLYLGPAPINDHPASAILLDGTEFEITAHTWVANSTPPRQFGNLWWKWTAPSDGLLHLTADLSAAPLRTLLYAYHSHSPTLSTNATEFPLLLIGSEPLVGQTNFLAVTAGVEYQFALTGPPATNINLEFQFEPAPTLPEPWPTILPDLLRGGNQLWASQTNEVYEGESALQVTLHHGSETAWIEAVFYGQGTLSYWVKTTFPSRFGLSFLTETTFPRFPYVEFPVYAPEWTFQTRNLTRATNIVRWEFKAPRSIGTVSGTGWLDDIVFTPTQPRSFSLAPRPVIGSDFQFTFVAEPERAYSIDYSTNLLDWINLTNVPVRSTPLQSIRYPILTNTATFFRATVR